jgi:hypothetical protein
MTATNVGQAATKLLWYGIIDVSSSTTTAGKSMSGQFVKAI